MNIRVTGQTQVANALANIRQRADAVALFQNQLSSGVRVTKASDDPTAFAPLVRTRGQSGRLEAQLDNIADATADLNNTVSGLTEANRLLTRASQIAQEGINGTNGPTERATLAAELDTIIDSVLRTANGGVDGRYLFAGASVDTEPFAVTARDAQGNPTAVSYQGAGEPARVATGTNEFTPVRPNGLTVFRRPGGDVFQALFNLRDELRGAGDPAALTQALADVQAARGEIGEAIGEQSGLLAGLETTGDRLTELKLTSDTRVGELEGTDYSEAVVRYQQELTGYQAALAVSAQMVQPTLLDYLK